MRKQTKLVAVLSAAALLAVGASMTSFAKGWNQLDTGEWEYLDADGERVTNSWKKYGSEFYFLGDDGILVKNRLIKPEDNSNNSDDYYYVDENGARVMNDWRMVENEDDTYVNGEEVGVLYYYFGTNGKAYKAESGSTAFKKKVINWGGSDKVFFFDEDAHMVSGWITPENDPNGEEYYYCGEEWQGYAQTDWQLLEVPEFMKADSPHDDAYEDWEYFCFDGSGKMRRNKGDDPTQPNPGFKTWYSNGWYYTFDCFGVYQDDWYKVPVATANYVTATDTDARGYSAYSGVEQKAGWVLADNDDDGETEWYYLVKVGDNTRNIPFNSVIDTSKVNEGGVAVTLRATSINKKVYLFDTDGKMLDGLQTIGDLPSDLAGGRQSVALAAGTYYFSKDGASQGQMLKGKRSYTDAGETSYYYFRNDTGAAYTNVMIDNIIYGSDGKRLQAEDGNKYEIKKITETIYDKNGKEAIKASETEPSYVIVSNTGKVATKDTKRKVDDTSYKVTVIDKVWGYEPVDPNTNY